MTEESTLESGENEPVGELLTNLQDIQIGMKLEAKDAYGKWYVARAIDKEQEENEVLVHFERWNSRYDEYIKISSQRLRALLPERREKLQKERGKVKKQLSVGDLVQAKWEDGRMYFGRVLKLYKDEVDVMFDDGVKYKAPLSGVRKRNLSSRSNLSKSSLHESDSSQTLNPRSLRAQKRLKSEDSASQASCSSPPSSPVFVPSKRRKMLLLDSDSSFSESDPEGPHSSEEPQKKSDFERVLRKRVTKRSISASSDSDVSMGPMPTRKKRRLAEDLRDPYKLRNQLQHLSPVKEDLDTVKFIVENKLDSNHQLTIEKHSNSEKSNAKDPIVREESDLPHPLSQAAVPTTPDSANDKDDTSMKTELTVGGSLKKDQAVAPKTRAQTKFENVSLKKADPRKVAPKEMVIVWDHNEFKCEVTGCSKSFRKSSLLQSHLKHYHTGYKSAPKQKGQSVSTSQEKKVKKERSSSPKILRSTEKAKGQSLSPIVAESSQTPDTTQQASKPHKSSPKKRKDIDSARKTQNTTETAKESEIAVPDSNHRNHSLAQQEVTQIEAPLKQPKVTKKLNMLSSVTGPMKVPMVELKSLPREAVSPKKFSKSNSSSQSEGEISVREEPVKGSGLNEGGDLVHCLCGDLTDEGFMIQCEECFCWQHGDCVRLSEDTLPDKYVCLYCTNPSGLRNRLKYQFDKEWFGYGSLPSVIGAPEFPHSSLIKHTHKLSDNLYQIKKMLHSSKAKLQAAGRVNHPYMRQWAKECTHIEKKDIVPYLLTALFPISYSPEREEEEDTEHTGSTNGDSSRTDNLQNGGENHTTHCPLDKNQSTCNSVPSLQQLNPLVTQIATNTAPGIKTFDSESLELAPQLPPLKTKSLQQLTTEILKKSIQLSVSVTSSSNSSGANKGRTLNNHQAGSEATKNEVNEVINDEFGVQELSVFAVRSEVISESSESGATPLKTTIQSKVSLPNPSKLVSSPYSAFTPVIAPSPLTVTTLYPSSTPLAAGPPQILPSRVIPEPATPKLTSTMDSVTLGEFSDAFIQGDTTNWHQRMRLLDHIEGVHEKVGSWIGTLEQQLDELPLDEQDTDNIEELLQQVQATLTQLRQVQASS